MNCIYFLDYNSYEGATLNSLVCNSEKSIHINYEICVVCFREHLYSCYIAFQKIFQSLFYFYKLHGLKLGKKSQSEWLDRLGKYTERSLSPHSGQRLCYWHLHATSCYPSYVAVTGASEPLCHRSAVPGSPHLQMLPEILQLGS